MLDWPNSAPDSLTPNPGCVSLSLLVVKIIGWEITSKASSPLLGQTAFGRDDLSSPGVRKGQAGGAGSEEQVAELHFGLKERE